MLLRQPETFSQVIQRGQCGPGPGETDTSRHNYPLGVLSGWEGESAVVSAGVRLPGSDAALPPVTFGTLQNS